MTTATLHRLLDDNLRLAPEYGEMLTNHLPMALHALHAMGAGDARLAAFFDSYAARLEGRAAPDAAAAVADWRKLRGQSAAFAALRATFEKALDEDGGDAVLRRTLPELLPGMAAAAFHGAIRTAHAVQSGHRCELASALAYWAWRWQPLARPPEGEAMDFDEWARALVVQARGWRHAAPPISMRMAAATRSAAYCGLAGRLRRADELLPRLAAFAAERYAATGNFTALHMVTGLRAVHVLSPWVDDLPAVAPVLAHAFCAAYLAANLGAALAPPLPRSWGQVIAAAIASGDDHAIKLIHACRDHAALGAGPWLDAARRAVA